MAETLEAKARAMLLSLASSAASPPSLKARLARKQAELETNAGVIAGKQTVDQRSAGAGASSRRTSQSSNAGTDMMQFKFGQDRQHAAQLHSSGATPASPADPRPLQYSFARSGTSQPSSPDFLHGRLQQSIAADPRMISFMSEMRSPALSRSRPANSTVFSSPSMGLNSPDARLAEIRRRSQFAQSQSTRSPAAVPRRLGESDSSSSHGNTLHDHAPMNVDRQSAVGQPQQLPRSPSSNQHQNRTLDLDDEVSPQQLRRASSLAARAAAAQSLGRTPLAELSQARTSNGRSRKGADGTSRPGMERARQAPMQEGHASSSKGPYNSPSRAQRGGRPATAEEVTDPAHRTARVLNVDEGEIYREAAVDAAPAGPADEDGQQPVQGVAIHIRLSSPSRSPSGMRRRDVTPRQQRLLDAAGEGQEGTVQPQPHGMKARELSPEQRRHVHALATPDELAEGILPMHDSIPAQAQAQATSSRSDIAALAQQISGLRDQLGLLLDKQRQQQEQTHVVPSPPPMRRVPEEGAQAVVVPAEQGGDSGSSSAMLSPEDPTYAATIAAVAAAIDAAEALLPADSEAVLRAGRRVAQEAQADLARQAGAAVDRLHKMRGEVAAAGQAEAPGTALDMAAEELSALAAPGGPLYAALFDPSDPHALINVLGPEVMMAAVAPTPVAAAPPLAATLQARVPSPAPSHRAPLPVPPSLTHAALQAERAEVVSLADQLEAELQAVRQERQLYNAKVAANLAQGVAHGAPLDGGVRSVAAVPSTSTASPSLGQGLAPLPLSPDELYRQFMGALDALAGMDTAAVQLEQLRADAAEAEAQKQSLALATEWQQQSEAAMVAAQLSALADQAGQEGARVAGQYAHAMENAYAGYANTQAELLAALVSNVQAVEQAAGGRAGQAAGTAPSRPIIVPDRTAIAHDYREALTAQASNLDQESMLSVSTEGGLEGAHAAGGGASSSASTARASDPAAQLLHSYAADLKRRMEAEMSMIETASKAAKAKLRAEVERIQARAANGQPPTEAAVLARAKYTAVTKYKAERARLAGKKAQVHQKYYEELLRFRRTAKSVSRAQRAGHAMRAGEGAALDSASLDGSLLSLGGADPLLSTSTDSAPGFDMPTLAPGIHSSLGATQDMLSSMMSSAASSFVEALMRSMVTAGLQVAGVTQQQSMVNTGLASTMVDHDALSRAGTSILPWVDQPNELVTSIQVQPGPIVEDGHNVIIVAQVGGDGGSRESTPVGSGGLDAGPGVFEAFPMPMPGSRARSRAALEHIHELADRFTGDVLNKSLDEALNVMLPARGLVSGGTGSSSGSSSMGGGDILLEGEEGDILETSASLVALPFAAPKPAVDAVRPKAAPAASRVTRKEPSSISPRSPLSPGRSVGALSPPLSKGRDEGFPTTSPDSTGPVHPLATAGVSSEEEDDLYDIEPPAFSSSLAFSSGPGRLPTGMHMGGGRMGQAASSPVISPTRTIRRTELTPREQWLAHATTFLQDVLSELGEVGLLDALVHAATGTAPILPRASLQAVELRYMGQGERGAEYLSADTRALLFDVWNEDIERMAQQHPAAMAHLKGIALQAQGGQGLGQHPVLLDLAGRLKGILSSRVAAMAQSWDTDPTQSGQGGEKERAALLLKADALARVSVKQSKRGRAGADMLTLHAEQDRGAPAALPGSPNTAADLITDELIRELLEAL